MRNLFPQHAAGLAGLLLALLLPLAPSAQPVRTADNGDGTFTNPILWGDWPDPDVIRVGDDFYMVSTSMHYVPGCPIATSKDLVNWRMAGYAVERYDDDPRYDMQGGTLYLNGAWASSIRYRDGKFYVAFCTPYGWGTDEGHFSLCEAERPEGPWTRTVFPEYMYDPGLFFDDDGRAYVVHGQGTLYVTELREDLKAVRGRAVEVWNQRFDADGKPGGGFGLEGAHMYKVDGRYYITCPAGGTTGWQVCLRSDSIYGPYEYKVIVRDDSSYPPNGLHQGGMVQLANGDWWFVIMQDRGPLGRVPCLLPVTWENGWPMLGVGGRDAVTYAKPDVGRRAQRPEAPATSDDFGDRKLGLQWQWNHNPDNAMWSLSERRGYLRLKALRADDWPTARNTLTQRVQGPQSEGTVALDVTGLRDGNVAGFGIFQSPYAYVAVRQDGARRTLVMCNNGEDVDSVALGDAGRVWLRARATDKDFTARFYFSLDGRTFRPLGNVLHMGLGLPWTANRFALFNFSRRAEGVGGQADFDEFRFHGQ